MSKAQYAETIADDPRHRRHEEQVALQRVIALLDEAERHGTGSKQACDAIVAVNTIWSALLEDLVRPDNDLPVELRARIISVGIFLLKEVSAIRNGRSRDFKVLRDITQDISEGLS